MDTTANFPCEETRKSKLIPFLAVILLLFPIILFFEGWLRIRFAIPMVLISVISMRWVYKYITPVWMPVFDRKNIVKLVIVFIIVCAWVFFSGIGGYSFQNGDHAHRNSLFEHLVNNPWPVLHEPSSSMMVYYFAYWLPAALLGKLAGLQAGYFALYIWTVILIMCFLMLLFAALKKVSFLPLIIFILFSGPDILIHLIESATPFEFHLHLERHGLFQISSHTTQLYWVFNQAVPAWLGTALLFSQKNTKLLVFILALMILHSTLPLAGLLIYIIYLVFYALPKQHDLSIKNMKEYIKYIIKDVVTIPNIIGLIIALIAYLFVASNTSSGKIQLLSPKVFLTSASALLGIFLEIALPIHLLYLSKIKRPLLWATLISFIWSLTIKVGYAMDFVMRASIPAVLVMCYLFIIAIKENYRKKRYALLITMVVFLLISSVTPINEIYRSVTETKYGETNFLTSINFFEASGTDRDNFVGPIDSFFGEHLLRRVR